MSATAFSSSSFNSEEYFRYRPRYPREIFDIFYAYHSTHSDSFVKAIDLACGCGNATFPLSTKFDSVVGLEPSEGMLAVANSLKDQDFHAIFDIPKDSEKEKTKNVQFLQGFAEDIKADDASVDLLISTVGANWFDWKASSEGENKVWKEFGRVLKPGGSVCLLGYWNWIARDYPLLGSLIYHSLPTRGIDPKSISSMEIVNSFYDAIPDPPSDKFDSERTMRLKLDLEKALQFDESIKELQTRHPDEIPDYILKLLSGERQTPLKKTMKISDFVSSFRTQSKFIKHYESNPEEKSNIADREDLVWRRAREAQSKQALLDSRRDGLDLKEGDQELETYFWDWEKECEVIYPLMLLMVKKKK